MPYSTGLELILNACEGILQIAVTDDEQPLCFEEWHLPRNGTEILAPALKGIFARLGIKADEFRRIACVAGPGSFTGIRLVLSTAAAIRRVTHAQLASLDYLQALATTATIWRGLLYPQKVFVLTHARRNLVHFQEYTSFGPQIPAQPIGAVELASPEEVLGRLAPEPCVACGSGLARNPDLFALPVTGQGPRGAENAVLLPNLTSPDFAALRLLARHGDYFPRDIEPKYVRGCDAVENLAADDNNSEALQKLDSLLAKKPLEN